MRTIELTTIQIGILKDLLNQEIYHLKQIPFHFRHKILNMTEIMHKLIEISD